MVEIVEGLCQLRAYCQLEVIDLPPPLPQTAEGNTVSADSDMEMEG